MDLSLREIVRPLIVLLATLPALGVVWLGTKMLDGALRDESIGVRSARSKFWRATPGLLLCAFGCALLGVLVANLIMLAAV
jgi:hypothetical protein